jgi:glycosyltransferase involved in cell wall biosynthesis
LASEVGSFNEEIIDGQNGLLVEPNSPAAISAALTKLIRDEKLYKHMLLEISKVQNNSSENWKNIAQKTKTV